MKGRTDSRQGEERVEGIVAGFEEKTDKQLEKPSDKHKNVAGNYLQKEIEK